MSDLISRQALLDQLESYDGNKVTDSSGKPYIPWWKALEAIEKAPTAYEVDEVAEQINTLINKNNNPIRTGCEGMQCLSVDCIECMLLHTIAIVKGAVKDE